MTQVTQAAGVAGTGETGANAVATKSVDFGYNLDGQLTSLDRYAAPFDDPEGSATQLVASTNYGYDNAGRLASIDNANSSGGTIDNFSYAYNPANEITLFTSSVDGTTNYGYDPAGQLVSVQYPSTSAVASELFSYDVNGNRTSVVTTPTGGSPSTATYSTGTNNEIASDGTYDYQYDADGNMIQKTTIATGAYSTYAYNFNNQTTEAQDFTIVDSTPVLQDTTAYQYDALGRMIAEKQTQAGTGAVLVDEHFVYDGNQIVMQFNSAGQITDRYLYGPLDQALADEQYSSPSTAPTSVGNVVWPIDDAQGSDHDLINSSGAVLDHISYSAFGNANQSNSDAVDYLFGYTGFVQDPAMGMLHSQTRDYLSGDGVWNQEDPIGFWGGQTNLSEYVGNDPADWTDPLGLTEYDAGGTAYQHGLILGGNMSNGDTIINSAEAGTINVVSGNLEGGKDEDFNVAISVLDQLGLPLPKSENGVYWGSWEDTSLAGVTVRWNGFNYMGLGGIAEDDLNL